MANGTMESPANQAESRELVLERIINATPAQVFKAWTNPEILKEWFAPRPWTTVRAELDVRAGGSSLVVMQSPEGQEFPCPGIYLEVVPNKRLVFTDAFTSAWHPSEKAFMLGIITLEDAGGGRTKYTATVRHWSVEDRKTHEKMGFHEGWGQCAEQLEEVASQV